MARRKESSGFAARLTRKKEPRSRTVMVRLTDSQYKRMKDAADSFEVTLSAFVRQAVMHGLELLEEEQTNGTS